MRTLIISALVFVSAHSYSAPAKSTFHVEGMTCGTCPVTVALALKKQPGVTDAHASQDTQTAEASYDDSQVSAEQLAQAITQAGYPARVIGHD